MENIERYINNTKAIFHSECTAFSSKVENVIQVFNNIYLMLNSTQKGIKYSPEPRSAFLLTSVLLLQVKLVDVYLNTIPCGSNGKEFVRSTEDPGSIPGSGSSPGEGNGHSLHYSCLGNSMNREA